MRRGALDLARAPRVNEDSRRGSLQVLGQHLSCIGYPHNVMEAGKCSSARAMALAQELGMRPLVAHCHLGLGKLDAKTGPARRGLRST